MADRIAHDDPYTRNEIRITRYDAGWSTAVIAIIVLIGVGLVLLTVSSYRGQLPTGSATTTTTIPLSVAPSPSANRMIQAPARPLDLK